MAIVASAVRARDCSLSPSTEDHRVWSPHCQDFFPTANNIIVNKCIASTTTGVTPMQYSEHIEQNFKPSLRLQKFSVRNKYHVDINPILKATSEDVARSCRRVISHDNIADLVDETRAWYLTRLRCQVRAPMLVLNKMEISSNRFGKYQPLKIAVNGTCYLDLHNLWLIQQTSSDVFEPQLSGGEAHTWYATKLLFRGSIKNVARPSWISETRWKESVDSASILIKQVRELKPQLLYDCAQTSIQRVAQFAATESHRIGGDEFMQDVVAHVIVTNYIKWLIAWLRSFNLRSKSRLRSNVDRSGVLIPLHEILKIRYSEDTKRTTQRDRRMARREKYAFLYDDDHLIYDSYHESAPVKVEFAQQEAEKQSWNPLSKDFLSKNIGMSHEELAGSIKEVFEVIKHFKDDLMPKFDGIMDEVNVLFTDYHKAKKTSKIVAGVVTPTIFVAIAIAVYYSIRKSEPSFEKQSFGKDPVVSKLVRALKEPGQLVDSINKFNPWFKYLFGYDGELPSEEQAKIEELRSILLSKSEFEIVRDRPTLNKAVHLYESLLHRAGPKRAREVTSALGAMATIMVSLVKARNTINGGTVRQEPCVSYFRAHLVLVNLVLSMFSMATCNAQSGAHLRMCTHTLGPLTFGMVTTHSDQPFSMTFL